MRRFPRLGRQFLQFRIPIFAIALVLLLLTQSQNHVSNFLGNIGLIQLNRALNTGRPEQANQLLRKVQVILEIASQFNSENARAWRALGLTGASLSQRDGSKDAFREAGDLAEDFVLAGDHQWKKKQYSDALYWYELSVRSEPSFVTGWQRLGRTYQVLGETEKSFEAYRMAWDLDRDIGAKDLATALRDQNEYEQMENVLRDTLSVVESSRDRSWWWYGLGFSLRGQQKWDEAATIYLSGIQEFPSDPLLYIGLGWARYERAEGPQAAARLFQQAASLPDGAGNAYFALGELMAREAQYVEADEWFEKAIANNPVNCRWPRVRARTARTAGNLEGAVQAYEVAVDCDPGNAHTFFELAGAFRELDKPEEAIQAIEQALALMDPPNRDYIVLAGEIYEWAGLYEKASAAFERAETLSQ